MLKSAVGNKIFHHIALISIGVLFYFIATFHRIAIPGAVFDILGQELNVLAPAITTFGAIFMYVYAFGQLIIGVLVDRYGGYKIITAGAIILTIGGFLFALSENLLVMYVARALLGLGASTFYLSLIKEIRNICEEKDFGLAISVMLFVGYMGGVLANAPFVAAMKYMSWRDILLVIGIICLIALIVFCLILLKIDNKKVNTNVKIRMLPFRLVLHKKHNRNLFSFACCNYGIFYVIQTVIGKKFLEDFCQFSSPKAAAYLSVLAVISAIFNLINASVCKLYHNKRVKFLKCASVVTFVSLLLLFVFITFNIKTFLIVILFFILAGNASLTSLLVPVLHLTNHKMVSGTAVSIMNFCFFMMVGLLGSLTGFLLNIFKPVTFNGNLIYTSHSYMLVFGMFLLISLFELYKAMKLSNKY